MKEIAIRMIDELGKVILPIDARRELGIEEKDEVSVFVKDGEIVLKKARPACVLCKKADDLVMIGNKYLCADCIAKIKETA